VDNFQNNFTYTKCLNTNETFKCDNGRCYNLSALSNLTSSCDTNQTLFQSIGYWNPNFPSQDYWK
jgi:hypothetical protein